MLTDAEDASLKDKLLQHKPEDDKKLSKPQLLLRWPMLVLICLLMVCDFFYYYLIALKTFNYAMIRVYNMRMFAVQVGNFYIFDNPTALYTPLWELFSSQ